jgi:hypothetical protein
MKWVAGLARQLPAFSTPYANSRVVLCHWEQWQRVQGWDE